MRRLDRINRIMRNARKCDSGEESNSEESNSEQLQRPTQCDEGIQITCTGTSKMKPNVGPSRTENDVQGQAESNVQSASSVLNGIDLRTEYGEPKQAEGSILAPEYSPLVSLQKTWINSIEEQAEGSIPAPEYSPLTPLQKTWINSIEGAAEAMVLTAPHYLVSSASSMLNHHGMDIGTKYDEPRLAEGSASTTPYSPENGYSPCQLTPETNETVAFLEDYFNNNGFDSDKDPEYVADSYESDSDDSSDKTNISNSILSHHNRKKSKTKLRKKSKTNRVVENSDSSSETANCIITTQADIHFKAQVTKKQGNDKENEANSAIATTSDDKGKECNQDDEINVLKTNEDSIEIERADEESRITNHIPLFEKDEGKGRSKRGRKRKGPYSRAETKIRKYNNLEYENRKHNVIKPKEFKEYNCHCTKKCYDAITMDQMRQEFYKYVKLGSYAAQVMYIGACVKEYEKRRAYVLKNKENKKNKNRQFSRDYFLSGIKVCREMFTNVLQITPQKIYVSLKKIRCGDVIKDKRGNLQGGWNKVPDEDIEFIRSIINKLPRYESHYRRGETEAKYLEPGMTVQKIYDQYVCEFKKIYGASRNPLSLATVKKVFYSKFDLKCKSLKKDTCNKCDELKAKEKSADNIADKNKIKQDHDNHLKVAEDLRTKTADDFKKAATSVKLECLSYDLEKTLPLPRIPTNIVFYKRQIWLYNSGVHSGKENTAFCYVWVEGEAGRGAQEVGSCLIKHIKSYLNEEVEELILWSDSCGGQNRNIKLILMLKVVLNEHPSLKKISLRYLQPGHSFLPNDTDFAKIEIALKHIQRLYTAEDYINVMKNCQKKNPFIVTKMSTEDFLSSRNLEKKIVNRKISTTKEKINWLKTKEIVLKKDSPNIIYMRSSFDEEFLNLNIEKKGTKVIFERANLILLYPNGKEINQAKFDDIKSMLHLIPKDCLGFYENLKSNKNLTNDIEGYGGQPDFVEENEDD